MWTMFTVCVCVCVCVCVSVCVWVAMSVDISVRCCGKDNMVMLEIRAQVIQNDIIGEERRKITTREIHSSSEDSVDPVSK